MKKLKTAIEAKKAGQGSDIGAVSSADIISSRGEILLYPTEDGNNRIECRFEEETLWLSQAALVELYQTTKANISLHLKHIFAEEELRQEAVVKSYLTTAVDGKRYQVKHYRLEAVLAVGYSRAQADAQALEQYARFEKRRRALAEAQGESTIRELADKAKNLPKKS